MFLLDSLRRIDGAIGRLERAVSVLCMVTIVASMAAGILFREILDHPLAWTNELGVLALVWITFFGASALYKEHGHLAVDALSHLLPPAGRRALAAILILIMAASMAVIAWTLLTLIPLQHSKPIPGLDLPRSVYGVPILWMAVSMVLTSLVHLVTPPEERAGITVPG
ncbi:MAG: TRAP transporter small permease [Alphaproteobacteria bacterium]|nr:TRAP transporter small permease [Alphaproteobacteria bacterium]